MNALSLLDRLHAELPKGFVELDERLEWLDPGVVRIAAPRAQWTALTNHASRRLAVYGVRVLVAPPTSVSLGAFLSGALGVGIEQASAAAAARAIGAAARAARCAIVLSRREHRDDAELVAELERAALVPILRLLDEDDPDAARADFTVADRLEAEGVARWWAAIAEEARRASGGAVGLRELETHAARGLGARS